MNRILGIALLLANLVVLGTVVRVFGGVPARPHEATAMAVTASTFTYQGRLQDNGQPITAACDLFFNLYDAATGGNLVAGQDLKAVAVTDGLFNAALDFGTEAFNGGPRWLETSVQCDAAEGTWTLAPRQPITVAPIALSARNLTADASPQLEGSAADSAGGLLSVINHGPGPGLRASADNGPGVVGLGHAGAGVSGLSDTGPGLAGTTSHGSGVFGYGYYSDAVGVTAQGNNGAPAMKAIGNAIQTADSFGLVKALLNVNPDGGISQCYNGVTGQQTGTGDCGFTAAREFTGIYHITFGFKVIDRFIVVTPRATVDSLFASTSYDPNQENQIIVVTNTPGTPGFDAAFSIAVF